MTLFVIGALALLVICVAVLAWPLFSRAATHLASADGLALDVLREQRRELDAELAAGRIDAAQHAEGLAELELRLVSEAAVPAPSPMARPHKGWAWSLTVLLPVLAVGLYLLLGNPAALDPAKRMPDQGISPAQIEAMVAKLEAKLKANPEDLEGLQMLARSYMVLGRYAEAARSYETLAGKQATASVYADWADALGSAAGNSLTGEPEKLIARALQLDANNLKALALAGTVAFDRKDYAGALAYWEKMVAQVDPQSEMGQSVQAMIKEARNRAGIAQSAPAAEAEAPALRVSGQLSLAAALKDRVAPGDTVFLFARPAAGGPPLAAMRLRAEELPRDFDFAQAQTMMGAVAGGKVVIGARVSKSGNASASPGDLEGFSAEVEPDAQGVKLEITTEVK